MGCKSCSMRRAERIARRIQIEKERAEKEREEKKEKKDD